MPYRTHRFALREVGLLAAFASAFHRSPPPCVAEQPDGTSTEQNERARLRHGRDEVQVNRVAALGDREVAACAVEPKQGAAEQHSSGNSVSFPTCVGDAHEAHKTSRKDAGCRNGSHVAMAQGRWVSPAI